jgi:hypothetical protein
MSNTRAIRPLTTRLTQTCFLGLRTNAIGESSALLNGDQPDHIARISHRRQETPSFGLSETRYMRDVENVSAGPKPCALVSLHRSMRDGQL